MASSTHYFLSLHFLLTLLLLLLLHPSFQQHDEPPSPKLSNIDLNVLHSIKDSLIDLPRSTFFSSWNFSTSDDPCTAFAGITCTLSPPSTLRVATLELGHGLFGSLGLAGSLPDSITQLTGLTQLILNPGLITGPIPELRPLTNLQVLSLARNRLTGPIPSSLSLLGKLHTIDLSFNRLTGGIPPTLLTNLPQLRVLILSNNRLTGGLPWSSRAAQLLHLDLKSNHLVGPIPPTLPLSLRYVALSQNNLWGPITNGPLDSLSQLEYLDLSQNQFSGPLPTSLLRPSLSTLLLSSNNFSGIITSNNNSTQQPFESSIIDLSHNNFFGKLPEGLAGATTLFLNNNRFSGPVPDVYINRLEDGTIKTLYLQNNFLDQFPIKKHLGGVSLPQEVEVCLSYNCMVPPSGLSACPTTAGSQVSRPAQQCSVFHNNYYSLRLP